MQVEAFIGNNSHFQDGARHSGGVAPLRLELLKDLGFRQDDSGVQCGLRHHGVVSVEIGS